MPFVSPSRGLRRIRIAAWLGVAALTACSPALDWRQVQPPGWSLVAALPCRPDTAERRVPLAGAAVVLGMWSCAAGSQVFAVASADVGDPARVGPALQGLSAAVRDNIAGTLTEDAAAQVPGMTPHPAARQQRLAGRRPDGQPVQAQLLVFAYGTRVFQASVLGPQVADAQARPLFESLGVRP